MPVFRYTGPSTVAAQGASEVSRFIDGLPDQLYDEARKIFATRAAKAHAEVQENARTKLKRRTGHLSRSIKFQVTGSDLKTLEASVYASKAVGGEEVVYAKTHEFGAEIKAKRAYKRVPGGPYLNIPTANNKTPAGVTRMPPKEVFNQGGFLLRFASGRWGVVHPGKGLMYILVKKVSIPARLGMRAAVDEQVPRLIEDLRRLRWSDTR